MNKSIEVFIWQERLNLSSITVFKGLEHEPIVNIIVSVIKQYLALEYNQY